MILQRRDSNEEERDGSTKKPRVVWSVEMHQQFVNAVNQLSIDSKSAASDNNACSLDIIPTRKDCLKCLSAGNFGVKTH